MNKYRVKFYYGTDLRCQWCGHANCEITAIWLAMIEHKLTEGWATDQGFRVEIHPA